MLFSNQYSRRFFWPRLSINTKARLDCCNTEMLFTVSNRTQVAFCPFSLSSVSGSMCLCVPPVLYTVLYIDYSPNNPILVCAFTSMIRVSRQVPVAKNTTNRRATVLDATGRRWMKYSGQASSSSVSVAHVPMCVFTEELEASQSMSSMTATNDNNHLYNIYIFI